MLTKELMDELDFVIKIEQACQQYEKGNKTAISQLCEPDHINLKKLTKGNIATSIIPLNSINGSIIGIQVKIQTHNVNGTYSNAGRILITRERPVKGIDKLKKIIH